MAFIGRRPHIWAVAKRFYVPLAVLMMAIAITGFWPSYFGPLTTSTLNKVPVIHVHAIVFTGWLILVIGQAALAASGRIALHSRVGRFGMAYGVIVILVGWTTALSQFAMRIEAGNFDEAQRRLFAPLTDMLFFAPVLWAAWLYRDKPDIHKRLIVVATTILLIAAVHRMSFLVGRPPELAPLFAIWLAPIYIGMAHDFLTRRLVQPVYLIGIGLIVLMKMRGPVGRSDTWKDFAAWLAALLT